MIDVLNPEGVVEISAAVVLEILCVLGAFSLI